MQFSCSTGIHCAEMVFGRYRQAQEGLCVRKDADGPRVGGKLMVVRVGC